MRNVAILFATVLISISGNAVAGKPSAPTAIPSVPIIVDSTGKTVGPVVPVHNHYFGDYVAALHRVGAETIKFIFVGEGGVGGKLRLNGPGAPVYFDGSLCDGGAYYREWESPGGASLEAEYDGYSAVAVYPNGNSVVAVRADFSQQVARNLQSRLNPNGSCEPNSWGYSAVYPVSLEILSFVGPFRIK